MSGDQRPHQVYIAWQDDVPLYVGCSVDFVVRLRQHEQAGADWYPPCTHVDGFEYPNKQQALEAERATIFALQPIHNVRGKDAPAATLDRWRQAFADAARTVSA